MRKKWIVFYHGSKELASISAAGVFDGEIEATKELLAYENNIDAGDIAIKLKERLPKRRYYAAYGSNINLDQMKYRCPLAKVVGVGSLEDYRLTFRRGGFANVELAAGESVPILIWETTPTDEQSLDRYEGYPTFYTKDMVTVKIGDGQLEAYIYIMTDSKRGEYTCPTAGYYKGIEAGYKANNMDVKSLASAKSTILAEIRKGRKSR